MCNPVFFFAPFSFYYIYQLNWATHLVHSNNVTISIVQMAEHARLTNDILWYKCDVSFTLVWVTKGLIWVDTFEIPNNEILTFTAWRNLMCWTFFLCFTGNYFLAVRVQHLNLQVDWNRCEVLVYKWFMSLPYYCEILLICGNCPPPVIVCFSQ